MTNFQNQQESMIGNVARAAAVAGSQSLNTRNADTMASRLEQIAAVLGDAEGLVGHALDKIRGVTPQVGNKEIEPPNGIMAWTMELNARAQRLREGLAELNNFLG